MLGTLVSLLGSSPCIANAKTTQAASSSSIEGKQLFVEYCASCHGTSGKGDGPAASALKMPPANLTKIATRNGGQFPDIKVMRVITGDLAMPAHGSQEMPVWGNVFFEKSAGKTLEGQVQLRIHNLTEYIKTLQVK